MKLNRKTIITIAAVLAALALIRAGASVLLAPKVKPGAIITGRIYTVKAADGSGEVPIYGGSSGTYAPYSVPDGTELQVLEGYSDRVGVLYEGKKGFFVSRTDITGEGKKTEAAIASDKEYKTQRNVQDIAYMLFIALTVGGYILFEKKARARFAAYYAKKRKQFPWLENWIKEHGDPEPLRMKGRLKGARIMIIVGLVAGWLLGGLLPMIIRSFVKFQGIWNSNTMVGLPITAGVLALAFLLANRRIGTPQKRALLDTGFIAYGLDLECPKCGCPHAWGLAAYNITVQKVDIRKSTTTTTTETKWKGGTPDIIDWGLSGFKNDGRKTEVKNTTTLIVNGTRIQDFHCENCNQSEHKEIETLLMDDSAANDLAAADDFYFEYRSDFRSGGETLAKWAGEFVERVKANAAAAKIPAEAVAALQKRTAEYTASYSGMGASYYYQSYVRDFAYRYLKDLPDEKRALFGMNPRVTRYAWEPSAKEVGGKSV